MGQDEFQKRLERLGGNSSRPDFSEPEEYRPAAKGQIRRAASPLRKVITAIFCGTLGAIAFLVLAFFSANYEKIKRDIESTPDFALPTVALAGASFIVLVVFLIWALITVLAFKRGRIRNVAVGSFFIGGAIVSLALRLAAAG